MSVAGYRASHSLTVTTADLTGFGRLLNAAVDAVGNNLGLDHLQFDVEDKSPLLDQARRAGLRPGPAEGGPARRSWPVRRSAVDRRGRGAATATLRSVDVRQGGLARLRPGSGGHAGRADRRVLRHGPLGLGDSSSVGRRCVLISSLSVRLDSDRSTGPSVHTSPMYAPAPLRRQLNRSGLLLLGPAFVAAVAYVDPGNFATNIAAGATYGYLLCWVVVGANLMAVLVQYLAAKASIATGRTLPQLCRDHFRRSTSTGLWAQAELVADRDRPGRGGRRGDRAEPAVRDPAAARRRDHRGRVVRAADLPVEARSAAVRGGHHRAARGGAGRVRGLHDPVASVRLRASSAGWCRGWTAPTRWCSRPACSARP